MAGEQPTGSTLGRLTAPFRAHHLDQHPVHLALFLVAGAVLALGAIVGVAYAAGFGTVLDRLKEPQIFWLPLALAGAFAAHVGYVLAYREVAHVDEGLRIGLPRAGALVTAGFGVFVPRGGFALDLEALRDLGIPPREARIRVLGLGSLEYLVLGTAALVSSAVLLARGSHAERAVTLSWLIGVPVGTALAALALRHKDVVCRGRRAVLLRPWLDGLEVVWKIVARPRQHGAAALVGMSLYWASEVFVLWACVAAFAHTTPSVPALVVGYATGYALTRRTLPLAGAGAVEALLPFALSWVGFPLGAALLAVVTYRVFNVWLPLGPALAGLVALRRWPVRLAPHAEVRRDDRDG